MDLNFPIISYSKEKSALENGRVHGESFRSAIKELATIRKNLMIERNPGLQGENLKRLALEQWRLTLNTTQN